MLSSQAYSILVTFLFLLLLVYAIFITWRSRKDIKITKTNRAIADTMVAIAYIDLPSKTFEEINFKDYVRSVIGSNGDAQEALNRTIDPSFVVETYYNRMKEFTDLTTVEERLKNKNIISEEYKGAINGWSRSSFIPVEYDKNGNLKSLLYTVQWINGEILSLRGKLDIEETLLECVLALSKNNDVDASINQLLTNVANFHNADRAYIFEMDYKKGTAVSTYEWCNKGITPQIQNLQNLKIEDIQLFVNLCKMEMLQLTDINYFAKDSNEYKLLEKQNITSLICSPLVKGGEMIGFIGVDNPRFNRDIYYILKSVTSFVITELEKKQYLNELYELSYKDMMTGVYNRYANMLDINELAIKRPRNIGIVYGDINGLKETNDKFDHEKGDKLIIDAVDVLKKYYSRKDDKIYRVGGDEFIVICSDVAEDAFNTNYDNMVKELGANSIISTGKSWLSYCDNISKHIRVAEQMMYACKEQYYKTHDRRNRA